MTFLWGVGVVCPGFDFPKVGGYVYTCTGDDWGNH